MMDSVELRSVLMFLSLCIPIRLFLVYLMYSLRGPKNNLYRRILATFFITIGISMIILFISGGRIVGMETGGREIWWASMRLGIGLANFITGILLLFELEIITLAASTLSLIEILFGIVIFIKHHFF